MGTEMRATIALLRRTDKENIGILESVDYVPTTILNRNDRTGKAAYIEQKEKWFAVDGKMSMAREQAKAVDGETLL